MSVIVSDIEINDAPKIAKWKSDPILAEQIMSSYQVTDVKTAEKWIQKNSNDSGQWLKGIYYKNEDKYQLVGVARLMFIDESSANAEFGIYIGDTQFKNKGIGKKALDLTLKSGFIDLNLEKIYLKVSASNTKAINLYLSRNFEIEGCLKEHFLNSKNSFEDVLCLALFKKKYI